MKAKYLMSILFLGLFQAVNSQPFGYSYGKTVSINSAVVTGTNNLSNFTILFKTIDPDLKSTSNGGNVTSANGYDIIFTLNSCASNLYHQIEKYDPTSGELICWIKIPTLNYNSNTVLSMYYGNSTITLPTSSSSTWGSEYSSVLHLNENPSDLAPQMTDGTANSRSGTCFGNMTVANVVPGIIANSVTFDEVDDGISINDFDYTSSFTISFWFNISEVNGISYQYLFSHGSFGTNHSTNIYFGEDNLGIVADRKMLKNIFQDANDATNTSGLDAGTNLVDGQWHYYSFVVGNAGGAMVYIDAVQTASLSFLGGNGYDPGTNIFLGTRSDLNNTRYYGSKMDEFRIINEPKSADWISTEYKNQNNPSSYFTSSSQMNAIDLCSALPIKLESFEANVTESYCNLIKWNTATEENCLSYYLEKSENALDFLPITRINAKNSINNVYEYIDKDITNELLYYRLKTIDYDSSYTYSNIVSVYNFINTTNIINPNPFNDEINIDKISNDIIGISIQDVTGNILWKSDKPNENSRLNLDFLGNGVYFLILESINKQKVLKIIKN